MEADVDCHRLTLSSFSSQNSKTHAIFCLRYVLIYNLEVAFNFRCRFHLTLLQLDVIKMLTVR